MTKGDLIKLLEPFRDDIEIFCAGMEATILYVPSEEGKNACIVIDNAFKSEAESLFELKGSDDDKQSGS